MQSLDYSAQGHSRCEVSEFQTVQSVKRKSKKWLVNTTPTAGDSIPANKTKTCSMGVIL